MKHKQGQRGSIPLILAIAIVGIWLTIGFMMPRSKLRETEFERQIEMAEHLVLVP